MKTKCAVKKGPGKILKSLWCLPAGRQSRTEALRRTSCFHSAYTDRFFFLKNSYYLSFLLNTEFAPTMGGYTYNNHSEGWSRKVKSSKVAQDA